MNFALHKHHGFSLSEIDNLIPFERDLYIILLRRWLEEEQQRLDQERMKQRA